MLETVKKILHQANVNAVSSQVFNSHDWGDNKISRARESGEVAGMPVESAGMPVHCQTSPPHRILVVEDEPDIRRLNAEVLKRSGYKVDTAEDGKAGWKALHAVRHAPESYDLLITDHEMPGLTGLALIQKVRASRMALPVIMATGRLPAEELFDRYPWLQPVAMLPKPYSVEQLVGTVEAVLSTVNGDRRQIAPPRYGPSTGRLWL
jgi:CheY-like chemotaxis protein